MKTQLFNGIQSELTFKILGGRITFPITDPNSDPDDDDKTVDESQSFSS